jgi:GntR family transcriptional regulator
MMQHSSLLLQVVPSSGEPIYRQLMEQIKRMIASGKLQAEDYLPSVRQLASELDINPMTISKAYGLLESQNIVTRIRGKGMQVMKYTQEATIEERLEQLNPIMEALINQSQQLDLDKAQVVQWFNQQLEKGLK